MRTKFFSLVIAVFSICFIASAQQVLHPHKVRVVKGIKAGMITKKEAAVIRVDRKEVKKEVKQAKSDGVVTRDERRDIVEERKEASKVIKRAKQNSNIRN